MGSHLAATLRAVRALAMVGVALVATPVLARQAERSGTAQAPLTVSVVVKPSCIFDVTPRQTGGASVVVQCEATDLSRARIRLQDDDRPGAGSRQIASAGATAGARMSHVPGSPAIVRTAVVNGSLLQIDF
jgi:hypothetical protein